MMRRYLALVFVLCLLVGCGGGTKAGDTRVREIDGMTMVYVPAGEFLMGSTDADPEADDSERPQHTVYLDAFWIDQTEVTNAKYRHCVEAGDCTEPGCWDDDDLNAAEQPVVCVTWDDAEAYAAWVGGRLPTEAEWEKAASWDPGQDQKHVYPWGDTFDGSLLNFCDRNCTFDYKDTDADDGWSGTAPVGSYPAGASAYGALDMAGNAWEWVSDWYDWSYYSESPSRNPQGPSSGEDRVLRGGSWRDWQWGARCACRDWYRPRGVSDDVGFRVVVDAEGSEP